MGIVLLYEKKTKKTIGLKKKAAKFVDTEKNV